MFGREQICPKCQRGKESYELDMHSDICPYIGCWKDGMCDYFVPLEDTSEKDVSDNKDDILTVNMKI